MRPATCAVGTPGMDQSTPVECLTPSLTLAHVPMNKLYITVLEALTDDAFEGDGRSLAYIPVYHRFRRHQYYSTHTGPFSLTTCIVCTLAGPSWFGECCSLSVTLLPSMFHSSSLSASHAGDTWMTAGWGCTYVRMYVYAQAQGQDKTVVRRLRWDECRPQDSDTHTADW